MQQYLQPSVSVQRASPTTDRAKRSNAKTVLRNTRSVESRKTAKLEEIRKKRNASKVAKIMANWQARLDDAHVVAHIMKTSYLNPCTNQVREVWKPKHTLVWKKEPQCQK